MAFRFQVYLFFGLASFCFSMFSESPAQQASQPEFTTLPERHRSAPESCLFFASWKGLRIENPSGSATEKWMNQPELKEFATKIERSVFKGIKNYVPASDQDGLYRLAATAGVELLFAMIENPGSLYVTNFELEKETKLHAGCFVKLGTRANKLDKFHKELDLLLAKNNAFQFKKITIAGTAFSSASIPLFPNRLYWAVDEDKFYWFTDPLVWEARQKDLKTRTPKWLTDVQKQLSQPRLTSVTYLNVGDLLKKTQSKIPKAYLEGAKKIGLGDVKSLAMTTGLSADGSVVKGALSCSKSEVPFLDLFTKEGYVESDFRQVSTRINHLVALKIDTRRFLDFVNSAGKAFGYHDVLKPLFDDLGTVDGVDGKAFLESLGPDLRIVGRMMLPNPLVGMGMELKINDKKEFTSSYQSFVNSIKKQIKEYPENGDPFLKPAILQKNGFEVISLGLEFGNRVYLSHNNEIFVIGFNARRVAKMLRPKPVKESITSHVFLKKVFENRLNRGQPFFVSLLDSKPTVETLVPVMKGMDASAQLIPGTGLLMRDIPSAKTLVSGWEPTVTAIYRTDSGLKFCSQMTAPVFSPPLMSALGVGLLYPSVHQASSQAKLEASMNRMMMLAFALRIFHASKGKYPALYSTDKNGKPLLSWRVHLLPNIGEVDLYKKFRLDEPWDSPHNIKLLKEMPDGYENPSFKLPKGKTNYLAVSGPDTVMVPPSKNGSHLGSNVKEITDGKSATLVLVEVAPNHAVPWTAPLDFEYKKAGAKAMVKGVRPTGMIGGLADRSARLFADPSSEPTWAMLQKMFTKSSSDFFEFPDK